MGIPYSKQINQAFEEVSPLVAATLDVMHTTQEVSYILAGIQVITAVFQFATVVGIIGLLITLNPDLAAERTALVTPIMRYLASWVMPGSEGRWYLKTFGWMFGLVWFCGCAAVAWQSWSADGGPKGPPREVPLPDDEDEEEGGADRDANADGK